ncbi:MAG: phospholipase D-like domain-containing protein, partial [Lachnospiraceae bacterium]|nr:phospholipase D-like domain-containing protein [Lachnospiraceae bacterium]
MDSVKDLQSGFETAFIDQRVNSNLAYRPEFISNDDSQGKRVISSLEQELLRCDEFCISVAFITLGGITPLLQILIELEARGIRGSILTAVYQLFHAPLDPDKLPELKNIELRMFLTDEDRDGFHTKGYIFRKEELYRIIVGSSNMTAKALKVNREWNTKLISYESGEVIHDILREFEDLWSASNSLDYDDFIENYRVRYTLVKKQRKIARAQSPVSLEEYRLQPNAMQVGFVKNIKALLAEGETRALLISATATGVAYASAFARRVWNPRI